MLDLKDLYQQRVSVHAPNFKKVILNNLELKYIINVANKIIDAKKSETAHMKDGIAEEKRFINGLKGEFAVSKYLGIDIVNSDVGHSSMFDVPDIPGYLVGVKTVDYGHFPVIPKHNTYAQVICICHPTAPEVIYICGLATEEILNKYQHDDLILDVNLRAKGTKTGFYGFSNLIDLSLDSIESFKKGEC